MPGSQILQGQIMIRARLLQVPVVIKMSTAIYIIAYIQMS